MANAISSLVADRRANLVGTLCLALLISAAILGCGGSGAGPTVKQGTPTPTSALSTPVPSASSPCGSASSVSAPPPGGAGAYTRTRPEGIQGATSTLTLCADGQYTQDVGVTGQWTFADGRVTFTETGNTACAGIPGIYAWSYDGTHLTLTVVSDQCAIRAQDFPAAPWSKEA